MLKRVLIQFGLRSYYIETFTNLSSEEKNFLTNVRAGIRWLPELAH